MNGYVIAALILAIFFCIGCIRIGGGARLDGEGLTAWVRLGPKKIVLYPMKPKPEKKPKKKPKPQKPPKPKKEKPPKPKSNLASMGIYIFSWKKMRKYLIDDESNPNSSKDFGKNILPAMLADGQKMVAYPFEGYWKDVGTIDSLWEANMDLLDPNVPLDLYDDSWKIYSRNPVMPPHFVASGAKVENSMITEGCHISGDIDFSILFAGVTVEEGAVVHDSIVMPGTVIKKGAVVEYAIVAENCVIGENAVVGMRPEDASNRDDWGVTVVGNGVAVGAGAVVPPKAMVDKDVEGVR